MLELKIRTLHGNCDWYCRSENLSITELKEQLYNASCSEVLPGVALPDPGRQNIVYRGRSLAEGCLKDAGIQSGETVVVLSLPEPPVSLARPAPAVPNEEEIRQHIEIYAAKYGLEKKLSAPEAPVARSEGLPSTDRDDVGAEQLQVIIDALEDTMSGASPPEDDPTAGDSEIPEPRQEDVQGIAEMMDIPVETARKALLLNRNDSTRALNWILEHQDDEDFHEPVPEETLRSLYSTRRQQAGSTETNPEFLSRLVEMGFTEEQASDALRRARNVLEFAISYLLRAEENAPPPSALNQQVESTLPTQQTASLVLSRSSGDLEGRNLETSREVPEEAPPTEVEEEEEERLAMNEEFEQGEFAGSTMESDEQGMNELDGNALLMQLHQFPGMADFLDEFHQSLAEVFALAPEESSYDDTRAQILELLRERLLSMNDEAVDPNIPGPSGEQPDQI